MLLLLAITKLHARLGQYCVKLHYGIVLGTLSLLLFAITKLRARLGQCCVKLHCGIVWERYRFFYWLLRSCAGNWFGVTPNQHLGIVVGMLSFPLRPLKRLPQRLSLKHNLQMAQTERSEKGIDEHISPQKICPKSNQHQCSPNINMH